ncbi:MAG: cupin domain-containing protein [Spirochaetes bacterium]|nr:cupin domain-containing protein [Spirochaetota bacterium]
MFATHGDDGYSETRPGVAQKTLVFGDRTILTEFILTGGGVFPPHAHPYEQTGYLVKGHIRLTIADREFDAYEGDSWNIPMSVEHGAEIIEDSVAIEVFSPVRKDYLPKE